MVEGDLVPQLGSIPIQQLRPTHILAAMQTLRTTGNRKTGKPLAPATLRKVHNVLHRALRHAVQWQAIPVNPADAVDRPSIPAATPRTLDPARRGSYWLRSRVIGLACRCVPRCYADCV